MRKTFGFRRKARRLKTIIMTSLLLRSFMAVYLQSQHPEKCKIRLSVLDGGVTFTVFTLCNVNALTVKHIAKSLKANIDC